MVTYGHDGPKRRRPRPLLRAPPPGRAEVAPDDRDLPGGRPAPERVPPPSGRPAPRGSAPRGRRGVPRGTPRALHAGNRRQPLPLAAALLRLAGGGRGDPGLPHDQDEAADRTRTAGPRAPN